MSRKIKKLVEEERYKGIIEDAWLKLGDTSKILTKNPFDNKTIDDIDNPDKHLLKLMRNPDYFPFTCHHLFNMTIPPFQAIWLKEMWIRKYPMLIATRGGSKSTMLALYAMLRATLKPKQKIILIGSGFRQSKIIFGYCEEIWNNSPILRDIFSLDGRSGPKHDTDRWTMNLGDSTIVALPLGTGEKIRGQRATSIIVDEMHTIDPEILETVIFGFASVKASPVEAMKRAAKVRVLKDMNRWTEQDEIEELKNDDGNQTILAGTAYYSFNHFYRYWKRQKDIIESKGDKARLREIFGGEIPEKFSYRDYSIIRMPFELLPEGFMDEKHVARSKATIHSGVYSTEYGAVFSSDSLGFFKRSVIEKCTTNNPIMLPSGPVQFNLTTRGNMAKKHVFAIDPASEVDNFSIVIIEMNEDHRRVVYCWTTTRNAFKKKLAEGLTDQTDFYGYCARKIRDLMTQFPCERIAIDSQGGGQAVMEALNDNHRMKQGEKSLWPVIIEDKEQDTDDYPGLHIIDIINFAKHEWVCEANHGMKKDFEDGILLFPFYDSFALTFAREEDEILKRKYDTLEDLMLEIEELKDELCTIVHTQLPGSGRDKWDTPEVKTGTGKKGRLRKDRYSALLMANAVARKLDRAIAPVIFDSAGIFAHEVKSNNKKNNKENLYAGPAWWVDAIGNGDFFGVVSRK